MENLKTVALGLAAGALALLVALTWKSFHPAAAPGLEAWRNAPLVGPAADVPKSEGDAAQHWKCAPIVRKLE